MQTSTVGGTVATDETDRLISCDKVVGTAVYNLRGEHLGSIYSLMIDKISGQVAYAVMSLGVSSASARVIIRCPGGC